MPEGTPERTVWPASLADPTTWSSVDEFGTAARAVHEAAHAVVAVDLGFTVTRIWVGDDERDSAHPAAATGVTLVKDQAGDAGVIVALAAWPATLHQLRLLDLDSRVNVAGFGAAVVADNTLAWRMHAVDHSDCPNILGENMVNCDYMARLVDTAVLMAHLCWDRIMDLAHQLAAANGRLDRPDIPTPHHRRYSTAPKFRFSIPVGCCDGAPTACVSPRSVDIGTDSVPWVCKSIWSRYRMPPTHRASLSSLSTTTAAGKHEGSKNLPFLFRKSARLRAHLLTRR